MVRTLHQLACFGIVFDGIIYSSTSQMHRSGYSVLPARDHCQHGERRNDCQIQVSFIYLKQSPALQLPTCACACNTVNSWAQVHEFVIREFFLGNLAHARHQSMTIYPVVGKNKLAQLSSLHKWCWPCDTQHGPNNMNNRSRAGLP